MKYGCLLACLKDSPYKHTYKLHRFPKKEKILHPTPQIQRRSIYIHLPIPSIQNITNTNDKIPHSKYTHMY